MFFTAEVLSDPAVTERASGARDDRRGGAKFSPNRQKLVAR